MKIVISSGHGKYVRGASGYIDEVDEARKVVDRVAEFLRSVNVQVVTFHDNTSTTQSQNLDTIVAAHNRETRDLDVSVHFNAYETTSKPMGVEVLYSTQESLAEQLSREMATILELPNRGGKYRSDLAFLNGTEEPAILIETCFVDSSTDTQHYRTYFEDLCATIAEVIGGVQIGESPPGRPPIERPPVKPPSQIPGTVRFYGPCSWFGGPTDTGVSSSEGLAFIFNYEDAPHLFLDQQPAGTSGLARRLNEKVFYVACRWDYDVTSKETLANPSRQALVRANNREFLAWPADWGPHGDTERAADISPGLMDALGITTDDVVEVIYPAPQG